MRNILKRLSVVCLNLLFADLTEDQECIPCILINGHNDQCVLDKPEELFTGFDELFSKSNIFT